MSQSEITAYIAQLTPQEQKVLKIAQEHLESSFNLVKSIGFKEWQAQQPVAQQGQAQQQNVVAQQAQQIQAQQIQAQQNVVAPQHSTLSMKPLLSKL